MSPSVAASESARDARSFLRGYDCASRDQRLSTIFGIVRMLRLDLQRRLAMTAAMSVVQAERERSEGETSGSAGVKNVTPQFNPKLCSKIARRHVRSSPVAGQSWAFLALPKARDCSTRISAALECGSDHRHLSLSIPPYQARATMIAASVSTHHPPGTNKPHRRHAY